MSSIVKADMGPFDDGCVFCRMKFDPDLSSEPANELLYSGDFHYVVCGLGAWIPGYVLLVTHRHFDNFARSPDEAQPEFNRLLTSIEQLFLCEFGEVTIFEHGAVGDKRRAGSCINHAHIHFIARNVDLIGELKQQFVTISIPNRASPTRHLPALGSPYLYVKQKDEESRMFLVDRPLATQFLRQKVAAKISMEGYWDYKLHPFDENIVKTIAILRGKIR